MKIDWFVTPKMSYSQRKIHLNGGTELKRGSLEWMRLIPRIYQMNSFKAASFGGILIYLSRQDHQTFHFLSEQ